jgi:hypothetical protein
MKYIIILSLFTSLCYGLVIDELQYKKIDETVFPDGKTVTYTTSWDAKDFSAVESVRVTYLRHEYHYSQSFNIFTADKKMGADFTISYSASGKMLKGIQVESGNIWRVNVGYLSVVNNPTYSNAEYIMVGDETRRMYFLRNDGLYKYMPGFDPRKLDNTK